MSALRVLQAAGCACALSAGASGQVHQIAFTPDASSEPQGFRPVDCGIGVSSDAVVVTSNMRLSLFDRSGTLLDSHNIEATGCPFTRYDTTYGRLFDPRTEYDAVNNRLWMMYSEDNWAGGFGPNDLARLHLAVSVADDPDGFDPYDPGTQTGNWHYFTGADALDLTDSGITPDPLDTLADLPSMNIDEDAAYLFTTTSDGATFAAAIVIPLSHSGGSILDGDRPDEGDDITIINLRDLTGVEDDSWYHQAVKEPFDQFEGAQFVVTLSDPPGTTGVQTEIRLGGLYFDSSSQPGEWKYKFEDIAVPATPVSFDFHNATGSPATPDSGWSITTHVSKFDSAVLAFVDTNSPKIFAAHHVRDDVSGSPSGPYTIQWYVIDPDLNNFDSTSWAPGVSKAGRVPVNSSEDAFHPAIVVTPQGEVFIEYTLSSDETWPQIRRAKLNSAFDAVVGDSVVQPGPENPYEWTPNTWADYSDIQVDPLHCGFWSIHVLAHDYGEMTDPPLDERDVWIFENQISCNNAEMSGNSVIDETDLFLYNELYALGSRRADMNRDFKVDFLDYAIYTDEYAKRPR